MCNRCDPLDKLYNRLVSTTDYFIREFPDMEVGDIIGVIETFKLDFYARHIKDDDDDTDGNSVNSPGPQTDCFCS